MLLLVALLCLCILGVPSHAGKYYKGRLGMIVANKRKDK